MMILLAALWLAKENPVFLPEEIVRREVRVQLLTPHLARIEGALRGEFVDGPTFSVVSRPRMLQRVEGNELEGDGFRVLVPPGSTPTSVQIVDPNGKVLYQWDGRKVPSSFLPGPQNFSLAAFPQPKLPPPPTVRDSRGRNVKSQKPHLLPPRGREVSLRTGREGSGVIPTKPDQIQYNFSSVRWTGEQSELGGRAPDDKRLPPGLFVFEDSPRILPPPWGATPAPPGSNMLPETSGWDLSKDAPDIYIFLPGPEGYAGIRRDFLDLTGHTPMPRLAAFGLWDSRYYPYKQQEALGAIDAYRKHGFPLDFFVVDTDWRKGGSSGYDVETNDFPEMAGFLEASHARHVKVMFNDHPTPVGTGPLSPAELTYRSKGVNSLLGIGADAWWYDRNWNTHLQGPVPGIAPEVWGPRLYHDITAKARPNERPMLMSNVQGIDNGQLDGPPDPSFHRYPIWWTGDTGAYFSYLKRGVQNAVDEGVLGLLPYESEDLGGHWAHPLDDLYVRYVEFGALSPVMRLHCTKGEDRHPWAFGQQAESIARDYVKLRYRLMPTLYQAAHQAFVDGTPIVRRCDLYWPEFPEAASDTQYMLGDSLLVAPIVESASPEPSPIPGEMLRTDIGKPGLDAAYFPNANLSGNPAFRRIDPQIDFNWKSGSPGPGMPNENFSVRWTGKLGPVPETGDYILAAKSDDGTRLFLDGKMLYDDWQAHIEVLVQRKVRLEKGETYDLRLEYLQLGGQDTCHLEWRLPSQKRDSAKRTLWLPPGEWEDLWTGERRSGPSVLEVTAPIWKTPIFARLGGIVLTAPEMTYTGEKPWDPITIDWFVGASGASQAELYEDDGHSNAYLNGGYRNTAIKGSVSGNELELRIEPASDLPNTTFLTAASFRAPSPKTAPPSPVREDDARSEPGGRVWSSKDSVDSLPEKRSWVIRVHLPKGVRAKEAEVDGKRALIGSDPSLRGGEAAMECSDASPLKAKYTRALQSSRPQQETLMPFSDAGTRPEGGQIVEIRVPRSDIGQRHEVKLRTR